MSMSGDSRGRFQNLMATALEMGGGSQAALAMQIGYSQRAVSKALNRGRTSAEMTSAIHSFTNGAVPKWELRPDLFDNPNQA